MGIDTIDPALLIALVNAVAAVLVAILSKRGRRPTKKEKTDDIG